MNPLLLKRVWYRYFAYSARTQIPFRLKTGYQSSSILNSLRPILCLERAIFPFAECHYGPYKQQKLGSDKENRFFLSTVEMYTFEPS